MDDGSAGMEAVHSSNAMFHARPLEKHACVVKVDYPGLERYGS